MTGRPDILLAAARAYCLSRFSYDGAYQPGGRDRHIAADAELTSGQGWLADVVDAVTATIRATLVQRADALGYQESELYDVALPHIAPDLAGLLGDDLP